MRVDFKKFQTTFVYLFGLEWFSENLDKIGQIAFALALGPTTQRQQHTLFLKQIFGYRGP